MSQWDYFDNEHKCLRCGHRFLIEAELRYGTLSGYAHRRIGDRVVSKGPFSGPYVHDRLLKYQDVAAGIADCPRPSCGGIAVGASHLIMESDIITGTLSPCVSRSTAADSIEAASAWRAGFDSLETALLVEQFGNDLVARTIKSAGEVHFGDAWLDRVVDAEKRMAAIANEPSPEVESVAQELEAEFTTEKWQRMRISTLGSLYMGTADVKGGEENLVSVSIKCPGCGRPLDASPSFPYGPAASARFVLGDKIDWKRPGKISVVRDPRVKYVRLALPKCEGCGIAGTAYVTVIKDVISAVTEIPADLLTTISEWRKKYSPKTMAEPIENAVFVAVRDSGADAVRRVLSDLSGRSPAGRFADLPFALNSLPKHNA